MERQKGLYLLVPPNRHNEERSSAPLPPRDIARMGRMSLESNILEVRFPKSKGGKGGHGKYLTIHHGDRRVLAQQKVNCTNRSLVLRFVLLFSPTNQDHGESRSKIPGTVDGTVHGLSVCACNFSCAAFIRGPVILGSHD